MRTRPRPSQSACTQATFGSPRENQLRALAVLEHVVGSGGEIFTFARGRMLRRWERLEALFASLPEALFSTPNPGPHPNPRLSLPAS